MKCANCGTENEEGTAFCRQCGVALAEASPVEVSEREPTPMPVATAAGGIPADPGFSAASSTRPPPAQPRASAPTADDVLSGLQNATSRLEAATKPYEKRIAPIQEALTPLEGIGKQNISWIGAALVAVGLFLPVKTWTVSVLGYSGSGSDSYWGLNSVEAILFLLLALAAGGLAYLRMYVWLWLIGGILLLFFLLGFINSFLSGIGGIGSHPSWGWILLFPGALALLAGAAMRDRRAILAR